MKKKYLHILAAALATCTAVGAADLSGITSLIPHDFAVKLALWPAIAAVIGHLILAIGDILDDGSSNGSFPGSVLKDTPDITISLLAVAAATTLLLPSCTGLTATATTPWGDATTVDGQTTLVLKPILLDSSK